MMLMTNQLLCKKIRDNVWFAINPDIVTAHLLLFDGSTDISTEIECSNFLCYIQQYIKSLARLHKVVHLFSEFVPFFQFFRLQSLFEQFLLFLKHSIQ